MSADQKYLFEAATVDLSERVMEEENVPLKEALRIVYDSALYQKLQNPQTGLYREGPVYLYDMLCEERGGRSAEKTYPNCARYLRKHTTFRMRVNTCWITGLTKTRHLSGWIITSEWLGTRRSGNKSLAKGLTITVAHAKQCLNICKRFQTLDMISKRRCYNLSWNARLSMGR